MLYIWQSSATQQNYNKPWNNIDKNWDVVFYHNMPDQIHFSYSEENEITDKKFYCNFNIAWILPNYTIICVGLCRAPSIVLIYGTM